MNSDTNKQNKSTSICMLLINKVPFLPEIAIESIRNMTDTKIFVGYMNSSDIEGLLDYPNVEFINLTKEAVRIGLSVGQEYQSYTSEEFFRLVQLKWSLFETLLNLEPTDILVYTDLDVAWLDNPLDYLHSIFESHSDVQVCIQDASLRNIEKSLCMGFVALKNSDGVRSLISDCKMKHAEELTLNPKSGDDGVITQYYSELEDRSSFWLLPQMSFPIGIMSNLFLDKGPFRSMVPERPFIFHANYIVGYSRKALMLTYALRLFGLQVKSSQTFLPKLYLRQFLLPLVRFFKR